MHILNHQLIDGEALIELPQLAEDATVFAWHVPPEYRPDGLFVSLQTWDAAREVPACGATAEPDFVGVLPAHPVAVLAAMKAAKAAQLAAHRYGVESAGILIDGLSIQTDRESRAEMLRNVYAMALGLLEDTEWKARNGFATMGPDDLKRAAGAVSLHVRRCFAAERQVTEQFIDPASDTETLSPLDVTAAFDAALATTSGD